MLVATGAARTCQPQRRSARPSSSALPCQGGTFVRVAHGVLWARHLQAGASRARTSESRTAELCCWDFTRIVYSDPSLSHPPPSRLLPPAYSNNTGIASGCLACPAGYVCANATADYAAYPCPVGFYCLVSTMIPTQFPCPPGTFNGLVGALNASACVPCTPGMYCAGAGLAAPSGSCSSGSFCSGGASSAAPALGATGGPCYAGDHCPAGSAARAACPSGVFCDGSNGLPSGPCAAGYYCTQGSPTSTPAGQTTVWGVVGNECPPGSWYVTSV